MYQDLSMCHDWPVKKAIVDLLISMKRPSWGGYECPHFEFQNLSFHILRRKPCHCWFFTIVFALFSSLSQFQRIFVSFISISPALCLCFKAMSLVKIYPYRASMKGNSKCTTSKWGTDQGSQWASQMLLRLNYICEAGHKLHIFKNGSLFFTTISGK